MVIPILIGAAFLLVMGLIVMLAMKGRGKSVPGSETHSPGADLHRTVRSSGPED